MKRATGLTLLLILLSLVATGGDAQFGRQVTVTAGTPIRVFTTRTMAASVFIQMKHGGTGYGIIYNADPGIACTAGTYVAELAPATATAPGGSYSDSGDAITQQGGTDLNFLCLDGSVNGDVIVLSYRPK